MELRETRSSSWSAELTFRTASVELPCRQPERRTFAASACYTRGIGFGIMQTLMPEPLPRLPRCRWGREHETTADCSESFSSR